MKKYAFPVQRAKEAILLGLYPEALSLIKPLSGSGNTEAQFLHAYLHFWDDELNQREAITLMKSIAKSGHVEANYILAVCSNLSPGYVFSLPTTKQAQAQLRFAAEHGSDNALTDLAQCYLNGIGVKQDLKQARDLFQQVYDRTHGSQRLAKNCFMLGKMLMEGFGEDQDVNR